jgi:hypothetical protein
VGKAVRFSDQQVQWVLVVEVRQAVVYRLA